MDPNIPIPTEASYILCILHLMTAKVFLVIDLTLCCLFIIVPPHAKPTANVVSKKP